MSHVGHMSITCRSRVRSHVGSHVGHMSITCRSRVRSHVGSHVGHTHLGVADEISVENLQYSFEQAAYKSGEVAYQSGEASLRDELQNGHSPASERLHYHHSF